jgi:oligosaccharide repeat unit polymerase
MTITLIVLAGVLTILLGRWLFGMWFNHLGLYGAAWSFSLALFHVGLIRYYPLETETWMIIVAGWLAFVAGSVSVVMARFSTGGDRNSNPKSGPSHEPGLQVVRIALWVLIIVHVLDTIHLVLLVSNLIGGLNNFFVVANILYNIRIKGGIPGAIPYVSSFGLVGCILAGSYTSRVGKLKMVGFLPLLSVTVHSMLSMDRGTMIIAAIMFMSGYAISSKKGVTSHPITVGTKIRRATVLIFAIVLFAAGIEFVRSHRGIVESYSAATSTLGRLRGGSVVTPSVFFYFTGGLGVLNQYYKKETEQVVVGSYSFAPFWRLVAKLGFPSYSQTSQPFYRTPIIGNTGTYLRELHADFGPVGVVFGPFLLGVITSIVWFRARSTQRFVDIVILGHLYVVVGMSLFFLVIQLGSWLASILFGSVVAYIIDLKVCDNRNEQRVT